MAGKTKIERCSWCGTQLVVPTEAATTVQCTVCQAISWIQPAVISHHSSSGGGQARDSIGHAASWFKSIVKTVISSGNTDTASPQCHPLGSGLYNGRPSRLLQPLSAHGRKRALLCGVSYNGQRQRLKGSINDVKCMRYLLVEKMGFPKDSVLVLTEEEKDPSRIPTKHNMRCALQWLIQGCQPGDSLVFHFSGHGSRLRDDNGDEMDGYDETLCPLDHHSQGMIVDDEINATIVRPLPAGAKLHALIDACHSGTVLDLPFLCRMNREGYYSWEDHSRQFGAYKGTSGGLALSFSACDDHQTSADTNALSGGRTTTGAMTYSFIQAVENEPGVTYGRLLYAMRNAIREARSGLRLDGPIAAFLNSFLSTKISQEPQLSATEKFDIYSKPFAL